MFIWAKISSESKEQKVFYFQFGQYFDLRGANKCSRKSRRIFSSVLYLVDQRQSKKELNIYQAQDQAKDMKRSSSK